MVKNNKKDEIEFKVKTRFGSMTVLYDYSEAIEAFKDDFREYVKSIKIGNEEIPYAESLQTAFTYAKETLIGIFPQVLSDALDQAYLEARAKTLKELSETPYLREQKVIIGGKEISKISPMQILKNYQPEVIRTFCKDVVAEISKRSRQRIGVDRKGGKDNKLRANYYAALENYYERHRPQANFILQFYKWKREHLDSQLNSKMNDNQWHDYFLNNFLKDFPTDAKILKEKIADARNRKDKVKLEKLHKTLSNIWSFPDEDITRWKETFHIILAEGYDAEEKITLENLKPEELTYQMLSNAFRTSPRTIKNNLKRLRLEKKNFSRKNY